MIPALGVNPTRTGIIDIPPPDGHDISGAAGRGGEQKPIARSRSGRPATGTRIEGGGDPLAIDELPVIALAACFAEGRP